MKPSSTLRMESTQLSVTPAELHVDCGSLERSLRTMRFSQLSFPSLSFRLVTAPWHTHEQAWLYIHRRMLMYIPGSGYESTCRCQLGTLLAQCRHDSDHFFAKLLGRLYYQT